MPERPARGTKEGDVFSFAIIVQEILLRTVPYPATTRSTTEILEFVKQQRATPFRPTFDADTPDTEPGMFRLMTSCWDEDPDERPIFRDVIKTIVKINGGRSET